jgi:leader peptidase (prepilin peptidase)/N-methyltransferase
MEWWYSLPIIACCVWVFLLGLGVGSFLNVVIIRLPLEKSVIWPGSRCGVCLRPLKFRDNLPVIGYLLLRGRCRFCGARFSSRYLWVELATGLAFLGLFLVEIVSQGYGGPDWLTPWHHTPGLRSGAHPAGAFPPIHAWIYFFYHALFLSLLLAAALIDAEHRIIPTHITYFGTVIGLIGSTLLPWPWPSDPAVLAAIPTGFPWTLPELTGKIPTGATLWPFTGPPPDWAPAGSWQLGVMNGLVGAAAGMFIGRSIKFLFETGFQNDALGLGDADLLMMIGAFLGWQPAALALPIGALVTLPVIIPLKLWARLRGKSAGNELPFGPGIAAGAVVVWFGWPWLSGLAQPLFDPVILAFVSVVMGGGMLAAGLILRRDSQPLAGAVPRG